MKVRHIIGQPAQRPKENKFIEH